MKKLLLLLFVYLSFTSLANAGSGTVVNVDGVNINFPPINSLTEAQEELVGLLNQMQPTGSEIAIAYVTPEDFDRFENYEEPTFTRFVQVITTLDGKNLSYSQFKERVSRNKKEYKEIEKTLSKVNELLVNQDTYLSSLSDIELKNVINAMIPFPAFIDNENTFAASTLVAREQTINGKTVRTGRIISTILIHVNKRILNVAFYSTVSDEIGMPLHDRKVKDWIKSFWKVN
jgi:hypothetical protein